MDLTEEFGLKFDLINDKYIVFLAEGSFEKQVSTGTAYNEQLQIIILALLAIKFSFSWSKTKTFPRQIMLKHRTKDRTSIKRRLGADPVMPSVHSKVLIKTHGSLMILAWIGSASAGTLLARYKIFFSSAN